MNIYPQFDLQERVFRFLNFSPEDFEGHIIVKEGLYNSPVASWRDAQISPGLVYWYSQGTQAIDKYIDSGCFCGFRYLIIDKSNGKEYDLDYTLPEKKKTLDISCPDVYLDSDACEHFFENLCGSGRTDIFGKFPGTVIDIGASIGAYTAGALRFGHQEVITIEPTPILIESLKETFKNFPGVKVTWGALSDKNSPSIFGDFKDYQTVGNRITGKEEGFEIPNYRLSEILKKYDIKEVSLVKMDIEGEEYRVIPGIEDWVWEKIYSLHLETHLFHEGDDQFLVEIVKSKGFFHRVLEDRREKNGIMEHYFYK